ncbi:MAG: hypothetical protein J6W54_05575 [Fibrobacter sp.]|uniref:hypothetical protein n=1 Tax=Fibrobacter sp. TaxID=35828 RepID=UPI001B0D3684|nr:hypothetical protein [Fibrobacter sp.]MBO7060552.1 hypothetical protein [Fibrobacter sp.]
MAMNGSTKAYIDENGVYHPRQPKPCIPEKNTRKKIDFINFLLDNITEPIFTYSDKRLNETFDISEEDEGLDVVKITFAIMNHSHVGTGVNNNFETFGHLIMDYVPERFRDIKFNRQTDTKHYSTAYQESVERFQEWICMMKAKIENHLSEEYYLQGRMKNLEILKRRYKQNWSESKTVDLNAEQNFRMGGDSKIELKITDA